MEDKKLFSRYTYYNKHKARTTRLNVKYQRMIMGAAAYASSHHVGIGYGTVAGLI